MRPPMNSIACQCLLVDIVDSTNIINFGKMCYKIPDLDRPVCIDGALLRPYNGDGLHEAFMHHALVRDDIIKDIFLQMLSMADVL